MDDIELVNDHAEASNRARDFLAHEYKDLINGLKAQIELEPTAGLLAVLVNAFKGYGDLYQVKNAPGQQGRLTELQVSRLIAAAVESERARMLEEMRRDTRQLSNQAGVDVREGLKALSDKSLG